MSDKVIATKSKITAIADAIRTKLGVQTTFSLDDMPTAIGNISGGGMPDELLVSEFDFNYDTINDKYYYYDKVKDALLPTNNYANMNMDTNGNCFVTSTNGRIHTGNYFSYNDKMRIEITTGTFDRTATTNQKNALMRFSGNQHFTFYWRNDYGYWWTDGNSALNNILKNITDQYYFEDKTLIFTFGYRLINGQPVVNDGTTDYSNCLFLYIDGNEIVTKTEIMTGDNNNSIPRVMIGNDSNSFIGACFKNVKVYKILNL